MITPLLEKMILNGWAQYRIFNNAYGSYARIEVPAQSFAVVTQIIWNHFTNPIKNYTQGLTWGDYFRYNEYQLEINTDVKKDYYQFRNKIHWVNDNVNNPIDLSAVIDKAKFAKYFIQEPWPEPVVLNTYLTSNKFIDLSITRNAYLKTVVGTYNIVNTSSSGLQNAPTALGDSNVILNLDMKSPNGTQQFYSPPGYKNANIVTPAARGRFLYNNDISKADVNTFESNLQNLDTGDANSSAFNPTTNFPLVSLGVVIVNKNDFDRLGS